MFELPIEFASPLVKLMASRPGPRSLPPAIPSFSARLPTPLSSPPLKSVIRLTPTRPSLTTVGLIERVQLMTPARNGALLKLLKKSGKVLIPGFSWFEIA